MEKIYYSVALDLTGNQIVNVLLEGVSSNPTTMETGRVAYNSTSKRVVVCNGTSWDELPIKSDVTAVSNNLTELSTTVGSLSTSLTALQAVVDTLTGGSVGSLNEMLNAKQDKLDTDATLRITEKGSIENAKIETVISSVSGNILEKKSDGLYVAETVIPNIPEYNLTKLGTATAGMSASYQLTKDGTNIGAIIDIPKDMVVSGGTTKVATQDDKDIDSNVIIGETYIVLTLANSANSTLYIPANKLVDTYEGSTYISVNGYTLSLNYDALKNQLKTDLELDNKVTKGETIDMNGNKITNLGTPSADSDAATKKYTDEIAATAANTAISALQSGDIADIKADIVELDEKNTTYAKSVAYSTGTATINLTSQQAVFVHTYISANNKMTPIQCSWTVEPSFADTSAKTVKVNWGTNVVEWSAATMVILITSTTTVSNL